MNASRPLLSLPSPLRLLAAIIVLITGFASGGGVAEAGNGVAAINFESAPAVAVVGDISPGHVGSNTALFDDGMLGCCVAPNSARPTIGFAPGEGVTALTPDRLQHGTAHLTKAGVLPAWSGLKSPQLIRGTLSAILESSIATFNSRLGGGYR